MAPVYTVKVYSYETEKKLFTLTGDIPDECITQYFALQGGLIVQANYPGDFEVKVTQSDKTVSSGRVFGVLVLDKIRGMLGEVP